MAHSLHVGLISCDRLELSDEQCQRCTHACMVYMGTKSMKLPCLSRARAFTTLYHDCIAGYSIPRKSRDSHLIEMATTLYLLIELQSGSVWTLRG